MRSNSGFILAAGLLFFGATMSVVGTALKNREDAQKAEEAGTYPRVVSIDGHTLVQRHSDDQWRYAPADIPAGLYNADDPARRYLVPTWQRKVDKKVYQYVPEALAWKKVDPDEIPEPGPSKSKYLYSQPSMQVGDTEIIVFWLADEVIIE